MYGFFFPFNCKSDFVNCTFLFLLKMVDRTLKQVEEDVQEIHCSRERSRAAWEIIEEVSTLPTIY